MRTLSFSWRHFLSVCTILCPILLFHKAPCTVSGAISKPSSLARKVIAQARSESMWETPGAIYPTDDNFKKFVFTAPRDYHVFVLFQATPKQYKCQVCPAVHAQFLQAAHSYIDVKEPAEDIFFLIADLPECRKTIYGLQIAAVPLVAYFPPMLEQLPQDQLDTIPDINKLTRYSGPTIDAQDVLNFVFTKTSMRMKLWVPPPPFNWYLPALAAALVAVIYFASRDVHRAVRIARNKWIWFTVSLIFYFGGISGQVYNHLRTPQPYGFDRNTRTREWFSKRYNTQYVYEGYISGTLNLFAAFLLISSVTWALRIKAKEVRPIVVFTCAGIFALAFRVLTSLFRLKHAWY